MIGPGKADLLEFIRDTGSIAAAGRRLGMSYKRAWMLVEVLNGMFGSPVVVRVRGGPAHGGASLTPEGVRVLALYRRLADNAARAAAAEIAALEALRQDMSGQK
jgi:molybdate transport system regulatory protein